VQLEVKGPSPQKNSKGVQPRFVVVSRKSPLECWTPSGFWTERDWQSPGCASITRGYSYWTPLGVLISGYNRLDSIVQTNASPTPNPKGVIRE